MIGACDSCNAQRGLHLADLAQARKRVARPERLGQAQVVQDRFHDGMSKLRGPSGAVLRP